MTFVDDIIKKKHKQTRLKAKLLRTLEGYTSKYYKFVNISQHAIKWHPH